MSNRKNLVAVGPESDTAEAAEPSRTPADEGTGEETWVEEEVFLDEDEDEPRHRFGWVLPLLAVLAIAGWTAFFGWAHQREMLAGGTPQQWSDWIVSWAVPVLLVVTLWLLAMRNSRREASRFAATAHTLSQESARLEQRLTIVNRELSLARDFIAAQSRDLESLGRVAAERLSEHAEHLQGLIRDNGEQVEAIGRVSTTALDNMDKLRDGLPVVSNSARDVANQIGQAGNTAEKQLDSLVSGFRRLNEFGEASERQVAVLRGKIDEALDRFEAQARHFDEIAQTRFEALGERSLAFRAELDGREVEALAALRRRSDALAEELRDQRAELSNHAEAELGRLQDRIATIRDEGNAVIAELRSGTGETEDRWTASIEAMRERMDDAIRQVAEIDANVLENARKRLSSLRDEAARVDEAMTERLERFEALVSERRDNALEQERASLEALEGRIASLDALISERQEEHLAHVSGLAERGDALASRMADLSAEMERLAAQGGETGGALDRATASLAAKLEESRTALTANGELVASLTDDSVRLLELIRGGAEHTRETLPKAIAQAEEHLEQFETRVETVHRLIAEAREQGDALAERVVTIKQEGEGSLAQVEAVRDKYSAANVHHLAQLAAIQDTLSDLARESDKMAENARTSLGEALTSIAERLGNESAELLERTIRERTSEALTQLEEAAERSGTTARETAMQLRDQLAKVNELAGNLESRVAQARRRAEEQVDNDFARRMALIIEGLNSTAIDISKAMSNEVTDTAWASYLRGDRGIFTRRAVRLLDNQEARELAEIYEADGDFRETVNRYIHDYEAMLRSVLSTRDGNSLAVTLLSSDMGKLYVALAQAIDRLRD